MSRKRKRLIIALIATGIFLTSVLGAWLGAPSLLTVDSGSVQAEALIVLGGHPERRAVRASELYGEVAPSWVIVSGKNDVEQMAQIIESHGVPAAKILREGSATSTLENASFSVTLLRQHHVTNVVLVTSWYHSRRALACFRQAAPEVAIYSRPTALPQSNFWWYSKDERSRVSWEYAKLLYYWCYHGVSPW